jgi:nitrogen fixation NifU-like protein
VSQSAKDLYQAVILEHNRNPRSYGEIAGATHQAEGFNPICGDRVTIMAVVKEASLANVGFTAQSCALCRASASVLMASVAGKTLTEVTNLSRDFLSMVTVGGAMVTGEAAAFAAIKDYPARAKCVMLAWKTIGEALSDAAGSHRVVSTESAVNGAAAVE